MIVLLICDQFPGILSPDIPSYEYMFEKIFSDVDERCVFSVLQTWKGELPSTMSKDDIYLISGSNNSAYDNVEWVSSLREWIRTAFSKGIRLAGICFGHQIIAEALGGKVERSEKGWGIGNRISYLEDSESINMLGARSYTLIYDHHDQVTVMPDKATLVSGSPFCPIESMRIGRQVITFQGHPEFSKAFISHWINDCAPGEPDDVKAAAIESLRNMKSQGADIVRFILTFFS